MGRIVETFAGPGGWDEGLAALGLSVDVGIEYDATACLTRRAAGHHALEADVATLNPADYLDASGFIASPPCQGFSSAGKGAARDLIPELLASIHARRWTDRADPDPRVWLIVDLGRWLDQLSPEWFALEQVPAALPIWRAYADLLRDRGYSVWTGVLNAADYGVPQTRERAILMASRTQLVHPPAATHDRDPVPSLFGTLERWVTMAEALPDMADRIAARWRIGFPRLDDRGDSPDGYRERDWRDMDEPSFALTEKARSWTVNTGRAWVKGGSREDAQTIDASEPAPTVTGQSGAQWQLRANAQQNATVRTDDEPAPTLAIGHAANDWIFTRPATTVQGDPRVGAPGHRDREGGERQFAPDAIRLSVADALVLQSFRPDYPVQGTKSKQFEQIGNAIPPRLAAAILEALIGKS